MRIMIDGGWRKPVVLGVVGRRVRGSVSQSGSRSGSQPASHALIRQAAFVQERAPLDLHRVDESPPLAVRLTCNLNLNRTAGCIGI